jgi:transcriptional regulator with XRE-family HTH domain
MNPLENHGMIIREIRRIQNMSVRNAAARINRSVGWLSEIENGRGTARLTENEFDRIVIEFNAAKYRPMFKTWIANHKNQQRIDKTFDGAILKHIRIKAGYCLKAAAKRVGISAGYLSALENGLRPMTLAMRYKVMRSYGYNPKSFKNLHSDPIKSRAVSPEYKIRIPLKTMSPEQIRSLLQTALQTCYGQNDYQLSTRVGRELRGP